MITYTAKLKFDNSEDKESLFEVLRLSRDLFNFISKIQFGKVNSLKILHSNAYEKCKKEFPQAKSQLIIKAEQAVLAAYRSIKANGHEIDEPAVKKRLSLQLDKRIFSYKDEVLSIVSLSRRVKCTFIKYGRLTSLLNKYNFCDPSIFYRDSDIYITFTFDVKSTQPSSGKLALGVDVGYRRYATTSEGKLFISKEYNKERRRIRYLKRCLQRTKTITAKNHLKRIRSKERNISKNFNHHLANSILNTKANVIVLEDLDVQKLKKKKHKNQSNRGKQVCLSELRQILTYKAALLGKEVVCVNPKFTSQIDSVTGKREGIRKGCRFYSSCGIVLDADVNAAINIANRSKLPILRGNSLDGQGSVNSPYICGKTLTNSVL